MRLPPSGCTSSGSNAPSSPTRARQTVTGRPCSSARAPMCGERARTRRTSSSAGRSRSSSAVRGLDLLGVGDAVGRLGHERGTRVGEHGVEQPHRHDRGPREDRAGVVVRADRETPPARRSGRRRAPSPSRGSSPRSRRRRRGSPARPGGATPARQERRVHVEPRSAPRAAPPGSGGRRRRRRRRRAPRSRPRLGALGLQHRDPEALGERSSRAAAASRRPRPPGASGRVSRAVISCRGREPLEHVRAERRRRGDGDAGHELPREDEPRPQLRHRLAPRLRVGAVDDQLAVEVVELVLHDARGEPLELEVERRRRARRRRRASPRRAARRACEPGRARGSPPRRPRSPRPVSSARG